MFFYSSFALCEGSNVIRFSHRWRGCLERVHAHFCRGRIVINMQPMQLMRKGRLSITH